MDELKDKLELIESVRLSESSDFNCDEEEVLKEYKKKAKNTSSLGIKILSIFGGLLATSFFMSSLGLTGIYESDIGMTIFGLILIVVAIGVNKKKDEIIIDTFIVSAYVLGYILLGIGLSMFKVEENIIALIVGCIAVTSLIVTQNYIQSFLSFIVVFGVLVFFIVYNESFYFIHLYILALTAFITYFYTNEAKLVSSNIKISKLYKPLRIALIFAFFGAIAVVVFLPSDYDNLNWLSSIFIGLALVYLVSILIKLNEIDSKGSIMIYSLSALVIISTIMAPSILGALLVVLLSFLVNYKTGFGLGIIALLYFISQFYYDLSFSLLIKSGMLFFSGLIFISLYLFTTNTFSKNEKI